MMGRDFSKEAEDFKKRLEALKKQIKTEMIDDHPKRYWSKKEGGRGIVSWIDGAKTRKKMEAIFSQHGVVTAETGTPRIPYKSIISAPLMFSDVGLPDLKIRDDGRYYKKHRSDFVFLIGSFNYRSYHLFSKLNGDDLPELITHEDAPKEASLTPTRSVKKVDHWAGNKNPTVNELLNTTFKLHDDGWVSYWNSQNKQLVKRYANKPVEYYIRWEDELYLILKTARKVVGFHYRKGIQTLEAREVPLMKVIGAKERFKQLTMTESDDEERKAEATLLATARAL